MWRREVGPRPDLRARREPTCALLPAPPSGGSGIRTHDLLVMSQAYYRTVLSRAVARTILGEWRLRPFRSDHAPRALRHPSGPTWFSRLSHHMHEDARVALFFSIR